MCRSGGAGGCGSCRTLPPVAGSATPGAQPVPDRDLAASEAGDDPRTAPHGEAGADDQRHGGGLLAATHAADPLADATAAVLEARTQRGTTEHVVQLALRSTAGRAGSFAHTLVVTHVYSLLLTSNTSDVRKISMTVDTNLNSKFTSCQA